MSTPENKWDRRSRVMRETGKAINGLVWGSVFLAIIGFILYESLFG